MEAIQEGPACSPPTPPPCTAAPTADTHVRLSDVIHDDFAVVETPDGRAWYRDEERCCEQDDGLRPYNPWRDNQQIHCNGCGALVFVT